MPCFSSSLPKSTSLFSKAKRLANPKFNSSPVTVSATNSALIELSISNNPLCIFSNWFNSKPSFLAWNIASANSLGCAANVAKVDLEILFILSKITFSFIEVLFCKFNKVSCPKKNLLLK